MKKLILLFITSAMALAAMAQDVDLQNWMQRLPDNMFVTDLSIPGTHDSGTSGLSGISKTQALSIQDQLNAGIRAFDFRPGVSGNNLYIYHGSSKSNIKLGDAFGYLRTFLTAHPSECVFVLMRHENDNSASWTSLVKDCLEGYRDLAVDFTPYLCLGQMRGKVLVMSRDRYDDGPVGTYVNGWSDNTTFDTNITSQLGDRLDVRVQDIYDGHKSATQQAKKADLETMLEEAMSRKQHRLYISHTSGCNSATELFGFVINTEKGIRNCAAECNKVVIDYLDSHSGPAGLVMTDFGGVDSYSGTNVLGASLVTSLVRNCYATAAELNRDDRSWVLPKGCDKPWMGRFVRKEGPLQPDGESSSAASRLDALTPPDKQWYAVDFDDSDWGEQYFPAGNVNCGGVYCSRWMGTYNTLWIRREFTLDTPPSQIGTYKFNVYHDDDYKVYVNGTILQSADGYSTGWNYTKVSIPRSRLRKGKNVIAVQVQQNFGGAYFDCGISMDNAPSCEEAFLSEETMLPASRVTPEMPWGALTWKVESSEEYGEWNEGNPNFNIIVGEPTKDAKGKSWFDKDYDSSQWEWHKAEFSDIGEYRYMTPNHFGDFYLRREFVCKGTLPTEIYMAAGHDDSPSEYYLNGTLLWKEPGTKHRNGWYEEEVVKLTKEQRSLIKTDGTKNVLAVHTHQNWGGYLADVGLYRSGNVKDRYDASRAPVDSLLALLPQELTDAIHYPEASAVISEAQTSQSIRDNEDARDSLKQLLDTSRDLIDDISSPSEDIVPTPYYNLSGQRVQHPRKGIFISGGRKYVIK